MTSDTPMTRAGGLLPARLLEQMPPHLRPIAGGRGLDPEQLAIRDRLDSEADSAMHAERAAAQRAFLDRAWDAACPVKFRAASLDRLYSQQDPQGAVSGWVGSTSPVLLLHGPSRHGKTYAAWGVAAAARDAGAWVAGWRVTNLMNRLRPSDTVPERGAQARDAAARADLVMLDDLGKETRSGWTIEQVYDLIDMRISEEKRTVITTNLEPDELVNAYGDAVVYRIADAGRVAEIRGRVLRPDN